MFSRPLHIIPTFVKTGSSAVVSGVTDGVNSVFELLDEEFLKKISARFTEMRADYKEAYFRYNY